MIGCKNWKPGMCINCGPTLGMESKCFDPFIGHSKEIFEYYNKLREGFEVRCSQKNWDLISKMWICVISKKECPEPTVEGFDFRKCDTYQDNIQKNDNNPKYYCFKKYWNCVDHDCKNYSICLGLEKEGVDYDEKTG